MSDIIKNNYKKVFLFIGIISLLLLSPTLIEIIFKSGNIVGTFIRNYGIQGFCI